MHSLELRIPPPLIVAVTAMLMWLAAVAVPALTIHLPGSYWIAAATASIGAALAVAGVLAFRRAGTTINPLKPEEATSLVTSGVFRLSRNPIYLGFAVILVAWAIFLANVASFLLVLAFIAYLTRYQIVPEERALEERFPDDFKRYCEQVHRWI